MADLILSTYEIIEKIGSGGGGIVYLANHQRLRKKVVLKADKRKPLANPEVLRREVDVLKNLSHTYIPQVYDYFIENDTVYTVMEYVQGESLDKPLKRGEKFSQPQVIKWAKQILEALDYLHSPTHGDPPKGYLHSDIKPANIMRTPTNDISLIDFNIALALGEENVVGWSSGYASPEHYGLDYSFLGSSSKTDYETETNNSETATQSQTITLTGVNSTETTEKKKATPDVRLEITEKKKATPDVRLEITEKKKATPDVRSVTKEKKKITPDVRSDIYSLGATLYHLLSGRKPAKSAIEVQPLSKDEFSPLLVDIISKALQPNPDLRYQSAKEMLIDLQNLRINDSRSKKLKRFIKISEIACLSVLVIGAFLGFVGLKRMQTKESWLKLAGYSEDALQEGDSKKAIDFALQAYPNRVGLFTPSPLPEVEKAIADSVGVYDLSDGYKADQKVSLESAPIFMRLSPDGTTTATICSGKLVLIDNQTGEKKFELSTDASALSEVEYIDDKTICYAGSDGLTVIDITNQKSKWIGEKATSVAVSADKSRIAGLYKDESKATIYDAKTGNIIQTVSFDGKSQSVTVNDIFANPNDNLFEFNNDGTKLSVSFSDGSLLIYDLDKADDIELFDNTSGFKHFEGGFFNSYFAFSGSNNINSLFAVIDTNTKEQLGGFDKEGYFEVKANETGIYLKTDNLVVQLEPVTGEQTPLITTGENIFDFSYSFGDTITSYKDGIMFFNDKAQLTSKIKKKFSCDFINISNGIAVVGSRDEPDIYIFKYENHSDSQLFAYDYKFEHDEARISSDYKTLMLFNYKIFRIYDDSGELICQKDIPNPSEVYDQQYRRKEGESYLEVIYNDGTIIKYNALDGQEMLRENGSKPDLSLYEEFSTKKYRIESPLHGTPKVYDKESNQLVKELEEDAYLTYVTEVDNYIITQYATASNEFYGYLLNQDCEIIGTLPNLCDVIDGNLIFDYPTGDIRKSKIYSINELVEMVQQKWTEEH